MIGLSKFRRRAQETSMGDNEPGGRKNWPTSQGTAPDGGQTMDEAVISAHDASEEIRESVRGIRESLNDSAGDTPRRPDRERSEESQRLEHLMKTDPRLQADPLNAPISPASPAPIPPALAAPQPARNILAGRPVGPLPVPLVSPTREKCTHCEGTGYVPSISDHLRQSIALVGDSGDAIVQRFYADLLATAPALAGLFPRDLLTTDEIKGQRDKLLKALVALSELYDPADEDKMDRLDTALKAFGRSHAAFARPDGTVQGATWEEYGAVKAVLFRTLVGAAGAAWKPEYTASWAQAYDYAAAVMLAEQYRSGFTSPRFVRA